MFDTTLPASDPVTTTMSWISTRGVETRNWPACGTLPYVGPPDHPILYLVEPGVEPPLCTELEDWVPAADPGRRGRRPADRLIARSRFAGTMFTRVDDDDVLRVGDDIVVLSLLEARLMRTLIDNLGSLVGRQALVEAIWPQEPPDDPRALDNRVKAVRKRIEGTGLRIHTVRGRGLLLERMASG